MIVTARASIRLAPTSAQAGWRRNQAVELKESASALCAASAQAPADCVGVPHYGSAGEDAEEIHDFHIPHGVLWICNLAPDTRVHARQATARSINTTRVRRIARGSGRSWRRASNCPGLVRARLDLARRR